MLCDIEQGEEEEAKKNQLEQKEVEAPALIRAAVVSGAIESEVPPSPDKRESIQKVN